MEHFEQALNGSVNLSLARKRASLRALLRQWSPFDRRMTLAAVRMGRYPHGNPFVSRDKNVMVEALRVHWSAVFQGGEVDRVDGAKDS